MSKDLASDYLFEDDLHHKIYGRLVTIKLSEPFKDTLKRLKPKKDFQIEYFITHITPVYGENHKLYGVEVMADSKDHTTATAFIELAKKPSDEESWVEFEAHYGTVDLDGVLLSKKIVMKYKHLKKIGFFDRLFLIQGNWISSYEIK